jgi:hypothetical protein
LEIAVKVRSAHLNCTVIASVLIKCRHWLYDDDSSLYLLIAGKVSAAHADGDGDPGPGGGEAHPHQAELGQSQLGDTPQEKLSQGENHSCLSRICIFVKVVRE